MNEVMLRPLFLASALVVAQACTPAAAPDTAASAPPPDPLVFDTYVPGSCSPNGQTQGQCPPGELFRVRLVPVAEGLTSPRNIAFMADGDALIESGQAPRQCSRRIALNQNHVRLFLNEDGFEGIEHARTNSAGRLRLLHNVQVVIDANAEQTHKGVQQVGVLARGDIDSTERMAAGLQLGNDRSQFDDLRARAEDGQDFLEWFTHGLGVSLSGVNLAACSETRPRDVPSRGRAGREGIR